MFNRVSGRRLGVLGVPFSLLVAASVLGCSSNNRDGGAVASPTPSPTPMPSVSPTPTPTPTASPSPSPTVTPSPTPPPVAVVYGVRDGTRLVRFSPDAPGTVEVLGSIPNLNSGESLIGIDVRPSDNALLATTSEGRLFKLENLQPDLITVRILQPITQAGVQLSATARDFGVDVNPFVPGTAPCASFPTTGRTCESRPPPWSIRRPGRPSRSSPTARSVTACSRVPRPTTQWWPPRS
jgi:hypothetical protein